METVFYPRMKGLTDQWMDLGAGGACWRDR